MRRAGTVAVVAVAALSLAGCGKIAERAVEEALEGEGEVDIGEDGISVVDSEGNEVHMGTGEAPEGFPDSIPLPEMTFDLASSGEQDGLKNWYVQGTVQKPYDEVKALYEEAFGGGGWTIENQSEFDSEGSKQQSYTASGNGLTAGVTISETEGEEGTLLFLQVSEVSAEGGVDSGDA